MTTPTPESARHWTLTLPYQTPPLTLNMRLHHKAKWRLEQQLQADAMVLARAAKVPACERISVELHWRPRARRARDGDNLFATIKPLVDGIRKAGVISDDDSTRVVHRNPVIHPPESAAPHGGLWLVITDLSGSTETDPT
ncbi:MAG TPA: hypothetical protein VIP06_02880 [Nocardioides sp.]